MFSLSTKLRSDHKKSKSDHRKKSQINIWHNSIFINIIIVLSFVLIAAVSVSYLMFSHTIYGGNGIDGGYDMTFHFQRIMDLTKSIKLGNFFPSLTFNSMSHNANAIMQLYPYQTLYPIAVFFIFVKPTIFSIYFVYMLLMFTALIISYYSSISVSKNKLVSYAFSIFYCLSSMVMFYAFEAIDIGALMAMVVLPVAIFGYVHFLHNNSWLQLTLGMILMIFSHVLTSVILIVTLLIWTLCYYRLMNLNKWIQLIKAILITTLTTGIFWLPSLYLMLKNKLAYPSSFGLTGATDIVHIVTIGLRNRIDMSDMISFFAVFGLLLFIFFWKKLDRYVKQFAFISVISLCLTTSILPWSDPGVASWIVLTKTPLAILQFTWRLNIIPQLCLSYIFAYILVKFCNFKKLIVPIIIIIAIIFQFTNQIQVINEARAKQVVPISSYLFHNDKLRYTTSRYYINKDEQLKYIFDSPTSVSTIYDYYPVAAMPMNLFTSNSEGSYKGTKTVKLNALGDGKYTFYIKPKLIYGLNLPIIQYNYLKYKTFLDGKPIDNFMGQDHLLVIPELPHGNHHISIKVIYPKAFMIARIFSIIGVASLLISILIKFRSKLSSKKSKEVKLK